MRDNLNKITIEIVQIPTRHVNKDFTMLQIIRAICKFRVPRTLAQVVELTPVTGLAASFSPVTPTA